MKSYIYDNYSNEELEKIITFDNYTDNGYPTSNCIAKGYLNDIFFKKLNLAKIYELYKGDYLLLFNEYYKL